MRRAALTTLAVASLPAVAQAHSALGRPIGFAAGFAHPFAGPDHALAMVSVGLWGAFLGRPLVAALPVVFPGFMALGALAGLAGAPLPPVELGIAGSVLALGLAVALRVRAPVWTACLIVGAFGLFHGYAHGVELPVSADPGAYCAGFVLATGLLHVGGVALGVLREWTLGERLVQAAGVGVALAGLAFLWGAAA